MHHLIVIDMQCDFIAPHLPHVQAGVSKAIKVAASMGMNVINVSYYNCGETVSRVTRALENVDHTEIVKNDDDATPWLGEYINLRDTCVLCGVNVTACVAETAYGLIRMGCNVHVLQDACGEAGHLENHEKHTHERLLSGLISDWESAIEWFGENKAILMTVDDLAIINQDEDRLRIVG